MIRSLYHHGAEIPATNLSPDQMRAALADAGGVLWVDMQAASSEDAERILDQVFRFHPLTIDDCRDGVRRPKLDNYGDYVFFVVFANDRSTPLEDVNTVELDVYLGRNFVVTSHSLSLPAIDRVAEQAMQSESPIILGADVLTHEILRAVESDYKPTMDFLSAAFTGIEIEILTAPRRDTLKRMHELRHDVLKVRRTLLAQQDVVSRLATQELTPINASNRLYFRELADRFARMVGTADTLGEYSRDAVQTHLSVVSSETNTLLRLVAAMVSILLLLTLTALLYGIGFSATPTLGVPYADTVIMGAVLLVAAVLAIFVYRFGR